MELFSQAGWEASVQVMLVGALQGLYFAIDKMGKSKGGQGGRIVNIASTLGLTVWILVF